MGEGNIHCILHIGTEKTGTTTIQRFLSMNRGALRRSGVLYSNAPGLDGESQWGVVCAAQNTPWGTDVGKRLGVTDAASRETYASQLHGALKGEIEQGPTPHTLLISSEHMHSRLQSQAEIQRLKNFLAPLVESFEIIVYFRRQDRMAASLVSTALRSGRVDPVPFPGLATAKRLYYYNFLEIYNNWSSVFGEDAVKVHLFDKSRFVDGDLVTDFCTALSLPAVELKRPPRANEALSQRAAAFANEFNRRFATRDSVNVGRVVEFARIHFSGDSIRFSRADARQFFKLYAESNALLRSALLPRGIDFEFDEDFTEYVEQVDPLVPSLDDAMLAFYLLWIAGDSDDRGSFELALNEKVRILESDNAYLRGRMALSRGEVVRARNLFGEALALNQGHTLAKELVEKLRGTS